MSSEAPKAGIIFLISMFIFWCIKLYYLVSEWKKDCPLDYRYFILVTEIVEGLLLMFTIPLLCIVGFRSIFPNETYSSVEKNEPKPSNEEATMILKLKKLVV